MSAGAAPSPIRTAPLALWRVAAALLRTLHALFGAPEAVAARHTLTAKAHGHLAAWLRCAEAMLRRLIVIEAGAYGAPNTRPALTTPRRRVRTLMGFTADQPERWRVSFRLLDRRHLAGGARAAAPPVAGGGAGGPTRFRSAWPLAERYEALLRVFNDPTAAARRASRRLHAAPHRLVEALRAPPDAIHRIDRFAALGRRARQAWRRYRNSS